MWAKHEEAERTPTIMASPSDNDASRGPLRCAHPTVAPPRVPPMWQPSALVASSSSTSPRCCPAYVAATG